MKTIIILSIIFIITLQAGSYTKTTFNTESNPIDLLAKETLISHLQKNYPDLEFVKVQNVQTQVVAGMNYKLKVILKNKSSGQTEVHDVLINVTPWQKTGQVLQFEKSQQENLAGGFSDYDFQNETGKTKDALVKVIEKEIEKQNLRKYYSVESAQQQVVAGLKFKLVINIGQQKYDAVIFLQPWTSTEKMMEFRPHLENNINREDTEEIKKFGPVFGNKKTGSSESINFYEENEDVQEMVEEVLAKKLQNSDIIITSATKKVVQGILYELQIEQGEQKYSAKIHVIPWQKQAFLKELKEI